MQRGIVTGVTIEGKPHLKDNLLTNSVKEIADIELDLLPEPKEQLAKLDETLKGDNNKSRRRGHQKHAGKLRYEGLWWPFESKNSKKQSAGKMCFTDVLLGLEDVCGPTANVLEFPTTLTQHQLNESTNNNRSNQKLRSMLSSDSNSTSADELRVDYAEMYMSEEQRFRREVAKDLGKRQIDELLSVLM
eukprot:GILJ01016650.1.p2 GENE.GILJ01016650.1~~GILJ01016650.1.p2  ORF type:complete len:189 (-),score=24.47 GILJ01016650.1:469-1035(-)